MGIYAVTGGAGFIGSHLVDALVADGHRVRVVDDLSTGTAANLHAQCELLQGDVCDPGLLRRAMAGADGCFHLAAIASVARGNEDWTGTSRVNVGGTVAVLDAARAAGRVPVAYASSAAVYGKLDGVAVEDVRPAPRTAYGADKLASELHAAAGALVHGVPSVGFRFFNVYGPRQDPASPYSGVISIFAKLIGDGGGVLVHGDGLQSRDFVHVSDVVAHLRAGMRAVQGQGEPQAHVLNVCTGRETTIVDLVSVIAELCGRSPAVGHGPARDGDIRRSVGAPGKASGLLGVQARTTLPEGLRDTLVSLGTTIAAAKAA